MLERACGDVTTGHGVRAEVLCEHSEHAVRAKRAKRSEASF